MEFASCDSSQEFLMWLNFGGFFGFFHLKQAILMSMAVDFISCRCVFAQCMSIKISTFSLTDDLNLMFDICFQLKNVIGNSTDTVPRRSEWNAEHVIRVLFFSTMSTEFIHNLVIALPSGQLSNKNGDAIMPERSSYKTRFLSL